MDHADPSDRRRYRALIDAQEDFPPERPILPTRLGNTLRAYEHAVHGVSATRLENFVREVFDDLPPSLQREHDDFRARLDLYCALVLVFALSGAVSVVALWNTRSLAPISAGVAVLLAWISYRAAIASAREYGRILQAIGAVSASAPRTS